MPYQEMNSMSSDSPAHHSTPLAPSRDKDLGTAIDKDHNTATDIVKLASPGMCLTCFFLYILRKS